MQDKQNQRLNLLTAILTDVQFWVPTVVLLAGIGLLIFIHGN
jgi:hypothetical protein